MRNWYARFVLWLIRPALELHRGSVQVSVSNRDAPVDPAAVESLKRAIENPNSQLNRAFFVSRNRR